MNIEKRFRWAFETRDIERFMLLIFPREWHGVLARILETGATFADEPCPWAARWSQIPPTIRHGNTVFQTWVKSCIFRAHDCIHQLWGLPVPENFDTDLFYMFKRANMCGEVVVLAVTEFLLCDELRQRHPEIKAFLETRNALPMLDGPMRGRSFREIVMRLDGILHKKTRPRWMRDHEESRRFTDDYVPMLDNDRENVDRIWGLMQKNNWVPEDAPNTRYDQTLDGLELTLWMADDFLHLIRTDAVVDRPLMEFNRERRAKIKLPNGW